MYKQITYPQRVLIEQFRRQGMSIIQIALELGFHRSTIYRELDRTLHLVHTKYMEAQERRIGGTESTRKGKEE
ncbi:MAG: helix-turn-helix domain-containing protein [Saprospiraceae bacterium]|nr:helix-turn-helix domain-containing protein [Saprospiraceae bacterium]